MELFGFDDDYVRRLRDGDAGTEEHFQRYFGKLLLIKLRARIRAIDVVEDLRQDVFVRVIRAIRAGELHDARKLGAFVNSVCNNRLLEFYRGAQKAASVDVAEAELAVPGDAEQRLVTRDTKEAVRRTLAKLPRRDADLLRAIFLDERDKDEVCAAFGIDREYLRVLLHRARDRFREHYSDTETNAAAASLSGRD